MEQSQFAQYIAVLMLLVLAIAAPFGMILMSAILGKRGKRSPIKDTAYECGMIPVGAGNPRMSVKFHLVAMLFILFDIEVVFKAMLTDVLHPEYRNMILCSMISFLAILFAGYLYALKKKAFDWKS
jgi:NADH-quinone oxidoreductase subunit A